MQHPDAAEGDHAGDGGRGQRPAPEDLGHAGQAGPHGVVAQVDRGEIGADGHREDAPSIEVGLTHAPTRSPLARPGGTRPDATAPATVPRKNGVSTDDSAKAAPNRRCCHSSVLLLRNANAAPLPMIPKAASVRGMYSVDITAAKTAGKPVHSITSTKISQTWLASQTGPSECSMSRRWGMPARLPPASRSHRPPPKSAPPSSAYRIRPSHMTPSRTCAGSIRASPVPAARPPAGRGA